MLVSWMLARHSGSFWFSRLEQSMSRRWEPSGVKVHCRSVSSRASFST